MAVLEVYAEIGRDGGCHLFTFDPPGLLSWAASFDEAFAAAPREAAELYRLLEQHGLLSLLAEPWSEDETPEFRVAEEVHGRNKVGDGGTKATFRRDLVAVRPDEIPGFIALMGARRVRLLTLKDRIPPEAYHYRSLPHRMTIGEQLRHIAGAEYWYLTRLWDDLPRIPRSEDVWHKLALNRERALSKLAHLTPDEMRATRKVDHQVWSARKLFRRFLYHEKFHTDTIERDLKAWLA